MKWNLRKYKSGDEHQIVKLFQTVFQQDMTVEQWRWKYQGLGLSNDKSSVAEDGEGRLIGHFGAIAVPFWFQGQHTVGYQAVDQMIAEEYRSGLRKNGLYHELGSFYWKGIQAFKYGFLNANHMRLGKIIGFFEDCISVREYTKQTAKKNLITIRAEQLAWDNYDIDHLWNAAYKDIGWAVIRDRTFLKWRFKENPFYRTQLYAVKKRFSKMCVGWMVVKDMGESLYVMDMAFYDGYFEALLDAAVSLAYSHDKKTIYLWLPERYDKRLISRGFVSRERGTYIPNIIINKMCDAREMSSRFYFTMADTDFM